MAFKGTRKEKMDVIELYVKQVKEYRQGIATIKYLMLKHDLITESEFAQI